jgi:hypothetical protein
MTTRHALPLVLLLGMTQTACTPRLAAAAVLGAFVGAAVVSAASEVRTEREERYYKRYYVRHRVIEERCTSSGCYEYEAETY